MQCAGAWARCRDAARSPLGVSLGPDGANVAVFSAHAELAKYKLPKRIYIADSLPFVAG